MIVRILAFDKWSGMSLYTNYIIFEIKEYHGWLFI